MFLPEKLQKVSLITLHRWEEELFEFLGDRAAVHLFQVHEGIGLKTGHYHPYEDKIKQADDKLIDILKIFSLSHERGRVAERLNFDHVRNNLAGRIMHLGEEIDKLLREIGDLENYNGTLREDIRKLSGISSLSLDIKKWHSLNYLYFKVGKLPLSTAENLDSLLNIPELIAIKLAQLGDSTAVVLISTQNHAQKIDNSLKNLFFMEAEFPLEYAGTPAEMIKKLEALIAENENHIEDLYEQMEMIRNGSMEELIDSKSVVFLNRLFLESRKKFGYTDETVAVFGYIPASRMHEFCEKAEQEFPHPLIITREKTEVHEDVPVLLNNPAPVKPFELITDTFGHPAASEIDPTPLIALTYPLMFGMMFGDAGQGAVLALCGFLLRTFSSYLGIPRSIGNVIQSCGFFAMIFGLFYGSFFGFEKMYYLFPSVQFSPMENAGHQQTFFIVAILLGAFQLSLGMILTILNNLQRNELYGVFFEKFGLVTFTFYLSSLMLAFSVLNSSKSLIYLSGTLVAIASVIFLFRDFIFSVFLGKMDRHKLAPGHLFESFMEFYEVLLGLASNTISYIRVAAFALAHMALMLAVFQISRMVSSYHAEYPTIVIGNLLVLVMEGVIVGIQALRLEYYEFFSKFYHGGGEKFSPLTIHKGVE
ncbi:MAG: V-type ATPase 116kDa subunit family protein [Candidatus Wallbacteria bacterium]|nr:V-type ATPase 116kDa subunit family protein [Candidatus Wallbacteria bacterium]